MKAIADCKDNVLPDRILSTEIFASLIVQVSPQLVYSRDNFVLIVLLNHEGRPLSDYKAVVESCFRNVTCLGWTLLLYNDLEIALIEGHLFYTSILEKGELLYWAEGAPPLHTLRQKIERVEQKARDCFDAGHKRATAFLKGAQFCYEQSEYSLSLFLLHQAVEQTMRHFILAVLNQDLRTHRLSELKQCLKKCSTNLSTFLSGPQEQPLFTLLENAYSAASYMDGFCCNREDVRALILYIESFLTDAHNVFTQLIGVEREKHYPVEVES